MPGRIGTPKISRIILAMLLILEFQAGKLIQVESKPAISNARDQSLDLTSTSNITVQGELKSLDVLLNETILEKSENKFYLICATILNAPISSDNENLVLPPQQGPPEKIAEMEAMIDREMKKHLAIQATESPILDTQLENSTNTTSISTQAEIERFNGTDGTPSNLTINKWEKKIFVFIDPCFSVEDRMMVENSLWKMEQGLKGCLEFGVYKPMQMPSGDYISFVKSNTSCGSEGIGKLGGLQRIVLVSPYCLCSGGIMHELAHALGIPHEQQRPDRDQYVTINWGNIIPEYMDDFVMRPDTPTFGIPYDIKSDMQYPSIAFSKNGKPTIVQKNGDLIIAPKEFQESDFMKVRSFYNCALSI